jgi:translation initiation factor 5A
LWVSFDIDLQGHAVIKGRPCKIAEIVTGSDNILFVGIDIFAGAVYEESCSFTHNMEVPHIVYTEYQLLGIEDGFLLLKRPDGSTKDDVKVPEGGLGSSIRGWLDAKANLCK